MEHNAIYSYNFERSFDYIWEKVVQPSISLVYNEIDEKFKSIAELVYAYDDMASFKKDVMEFYLEKREWLKSVYLPHEDHPILDEHKLGAIWCRTMLAYKPFHFNFNAAKDFVKYEFGKKETNTDMGEPKNNSEWFTKNIYSNYRVAFLVSIGVVYLYLLYDCKELGEDVPEYLEKAYEYFLAGKTMQCPPTKQSHNDFQTSCIIALQKNDVLERDFDYLTYAVMLFQLEHYNKMCYYLHMHGLQIDDI